MTAIPGIEIDYPTSDGKPMAETDYHRKLMQEVIETLDGFFASDPNVYVSGNLLVFYEEGKPRRHLAPDVFVVWGVPKRDRLTYKIWEEGKAPGVVIEITSSSTKREDLKKKLDIYRDIWKVKEYFLFDPLEEYLDPSMRGFRLVRGRYKTIEADSSGRLRCRRLGLDLERQGKRLVFHDSATGQEILKPERKRNLELQRRAEQAEAELEKVRRELDAFRQSQPAPRTNHRRNGK
jgi:Uma2 family endonuclease